MSRRGSRSKKKTFELVRQGDEEEFHTSKRSKETLSLPPRRPKKQNLYVEAAKGGSLDPDDDGDEDFAVGPAGRKAGSARKMNAGGIVNANLTSTSKVVSVTRSEEEEEKQDDLRGGSFFFFALVLQVYS